MTPEISIEDVVVLDCERHEDDRGAFTEMYRRSRVDRDFLQLNHSHSRAGVLRGLHYHRVQTDLWHLIRGRVQVCLVDLRRRGPTPHVDLFTVDGRAGLSFLIPPGVAHGFLALSEIDLIYLVTHEFDASDEYGIAWNDPALSIPWEEGTPILSHRDSTNPPLDWAQVPAFS